MGKMTWVDIHGLRAAPRIRVGPVHNAVGGNAPVFTAKGAAFANLVKTQRGRGGENRTGPHVLVEVIHGILR